MGQEKLEISLFGACVVKLSGTHSVHLTGIKHRAIIALLATAPMGVRTRVFLQDTLWGEGCYDGGRQSLRRALSDMRAKMGSAFQNLFEINNHEIKINLDMVSFITNSNDGILLEGMDIKENGFNAWLRDIRLNPTQVEARITQGTEAPPLQLAPVIATIPFQLVHGDVEHTLLGDWLAEDICRSLSRSSFLAVISHFSARSLVSNSLNLLEIREKLHANYAIIGSIRVYADEILLDIDCVDCITGQILWTRRFEGEVSKIRALNEQLTSEVVASIGRTVIDESISNVTKRAVEDVNGHRLLIAGVALMHRQTLTSFSKGRELIEEAIKRAGSRPELYAWLAKWYILSVFNGWTTDAEGDTQRALDQTGHALDLDPECSLSLTIDGFAHSNLLKDLDTAESRYRMALDANPNEALSWLLSGTLNGFKGSTKAGILETEKAHRLSPLDPFGYFYDSLRASTFLADHQFDKALQLAQASYDKNSRHTSTLRVKIAALHGLGRQEAANKVAKELLACQPDFTTSNYLNSHPAADFPIGNLMASAFRASGIPN